MLKGFNERDRYTIVGRLAVDLEDVKLEIEHHEQYLKLQPGPSRSMDSLAHRLDRVIDTIKVQCEERHRAEEMRRVSEAAGRHEREIQQIRDALTAALAGNPKQLRAAIERVVADHEPIPF